MAVEARRGCGYRKVGGLYLVGSGGGIACDRLPIELCVCPTCGTGIKQTRGWTWVDTAALLGGNHMVPPPYNHNDSHPEPIPCGCNIICPLCHNVGSMGKSGLLWIGMQFYPTIEAFEMEAKSLGISRRITALPRGFKLGESWVMFAHARGIIKATGDLTAKYVPAIFRVWKPERIERIYTESARGSEDVLADEKRGITPVFVPDNDTDHQGSVFDKEEENVPETTTEIPPPMFAAGQ